jgi:subtilisin family serine protease
MAMRRGIVVVTASGNERAAAWHYLLAPSDADTVIASGAVDSFNVVTSFSSPGPSADGRIKPDVSAMGSRVYVPSYSTTNTYARVSGTSFSTPLTAAMAALLLEAHPNWNPFTVREALRETALGAAMPNNDVGWGLIQMTGALAWTPSTIDVARPGGSATGREALALTAGPNPFTPSRTTTSIRFTAPGTVTLDAFDVHGRRVARLFAGDAAGGRSIAWRGADDRGVPVPAGVYWLRLASSGATRTLRVVATR